MAARAGVCFAAVKIIARTSEPFNALAGSYDRITIPTIRVAFALSFFLHAAALIGWLPKLSTVTMLPFEDPKLGKPSGSLAVRLTPLPRDQSAALAPPVIRAKPSLARNAPPPRAAPQPPSAPPVLALEQGPPLSAAEQPPVLRTPAPVYADLASLIAARRRARESDAAAPASPGSPPAPPAQSEQERHNRVVATNLGLNRTPGFGADPKPGGGVFQIRRMGYDDAEFTFFGWNKYIGRNARQTIEVSRAGNASMEIAVVRKMISIIREHAREDFQWDSPRLRREVTLSARLNDNAGLEDFMLYEFFPDFRSRN